MFNNLKLDKQTHTYYLGDKTLPSVSSKVAEFYEPFDRNISKYVAKSKGVTQTEILKDWDKKRDDALLLGNNTHDFAENWAKKIYKNPVTEKELGVIQFFLDHSEYKVKHAELSMYNKELEYAGTTDLILEYKDKTILADWKSNKDLYKTHGKLKKPFSNFNNNPLNKYKIQLNLYQLCLESVGIEVSERWIIWLNRDKKNFKFYKKIKVPNITSRLLSYYDSNIR